MVLDLLASEVFTSIFISAGKGTCNRLEKI